MPDDKRDAFGMNAAALGAALRGDIANAIIASTPGGIEAQEAAGQDKLCREAGRLPVKGTLEPPAYSNVAAMTLRTQWEAVGFKFTRLVQESNGRIVFVECEFPAGWKLVPTSHSMWSDVRDDKGRKRAAVFFKAAFYDYNAHTFGLECRYACGADYIDNKNYDDRRMVHYVNDAATGTRVFEVTDAEQPTKDEFGPYPNRKAAEEWLAQHFPDHADPLAYWD